MAKFPSCEYNAWTMHHCSCPRLRRRRLATTARCCFLCLHGRRACAALPPHRPPSLWREVERYRISFAAGYPYMFPKSIPGETWREWSQNSLSIREWGEDGYTREEKVWGRVSPFLPIPLCRTADWLTSTVSTDCLRSRSGGAAPLARAVIGGHLGHDWFNT